MNYAHDPVPGGNIKNEKPIQWFQNNMNIVRLGLVEGKEISGCRDCHSMEQYNKISGRQRQLLKIGVTVDDFEKTMLSSNWLNEFQKSHNNNGATVQSPIDWQIDLGNYCNGACVFCGPEYSSRLAVEFKKIGLIGEMPPKNWCDDPYLLDIFIDTIKNISNLRYLHFIGGETLITPAFQTILEALISAGLNHRVSIGFTTGLTLWKESTVDLLKQFKEVNLGLSIECFHPTNDYVRYGTNIDQAKEYISRWLEISKELGWLTQIRTTPTILSVWHLDTVYEYAWQNQLSVESCNFLTRPDFMRPSVLPSNLRLVVINKLKKWVSDKTISTAESVLNTRNPEFYQHQLIQDAESYIDYLSKQQDESHRAIDLVVYLKKLEDSRGNHILDYLPEYESFLRSAGY
jgi:hypothetical protein